MQNSQRISTALQHTTDTKALVLGKNAMEQAPKVFRELFGDAHCILVADTNTYNAAGRVVESYLREAGVALEPSFVFTDKDLYAEWSYVEQLEKRLSTIDAVAIAVGSGVINDLTKLVSSHLNRGYMVVGTATSMDGYTAYGASITYHGNKQTFNCPAPRGIILDPSVAARAPQGMSASGYADLIAKIPAGADWMIADALGIEKIDPFTWELVQGELRKSLSDPKGAAEGKVEPTEMLADGLIMSGFAMQALQSSRPASGSEHQFSHYWDMRGLCFNGKHVSHGFKVGIGTLASTAMLEMLLDTDINAIDIDKCVAQWKSWNDTQNDIQALFEGCPGLIERGLTETKGKYINQSQLKEQLVLFKKVWPELKERIASQIMSFDEVYQNLRQVGAPYAPEMIGVSRSELREVFKAIPYMRSRFTAFDIIFRLGLYEQFTARLFDRGGIWETK